MDSTFLQVLLVVVASIAGAVWIALDPQDKGATSRTKRRAAATHRPDAGAAAASPSPVAIGAEPAAGVTVAIATPAPPAATVGDRLRSGVVLLIVLTMVGVMVAVTLGSVVVLTALAVRGAVS